MTPCVCHVCGRGPEGGFSVFRQNEKGQPAIWACIEHYDRALDPTVASIVRAIEDAETKAKPQ